MTNIDCETFVKSLLAIQWMLNDLPRNMRKDLQSQIGLIWLLIADPSCFPSITFSKNQQKAICDALRDNSPDSINFKFTYEAAMEYSKKLKTKKDESNEEETPPKMLLSSDPDAPENMPSTATHNNTES